MSARTSVRSSSVRPGRTDLRCWTGVHPDEPIRTRMCGPEEAVVGQSEECGAAQSPIDEIMTRRIACRDFCDAPVPRRTIEQILHVARLRAKRCEYSALACLRAGWRRQGPRL